MDMPSDDGYELFSRAIVNRDQDAWARIHERYRVLLIAWARQSGVQLIVSEQYEDIADQAFARAWSALTPGRFPEFAALAPILAYLRTCVSAVLIDLARAQATRERTTQKLNPENAATPEEVVLEHMDQTELWKLVHTLVETPQELAILRQVIILGIPPRVLLQRRPDLFRTVGEIYAAKRNLLCRLQRNHALQQLWSEMFS
jgi:DNA-directed RNA polymerase specialized sigma24 family protein